MEHINFCKILPQKRTRLVQRKIKFSRSLLPLVNTFKCIARLHLSLYLHGAVVQHLIQRSPSDSEVYYVSSLLQLAVASLSLNAI